MIVDAFTSLGPWSWIVLGVILIGIEVLAPGVFFIWLGLAAVATGLLSAALGLSWQVAALTFAALAVVAVFVGRTLMRSTKQQDTQAGLLNRRGEVLIGRVFTLDVPIVDGAGRVRIGDSFWGVSGPDLPAGARIRVTRVEGTTLVVEGA